MLLLDLLVEFLYLHPSLYHLLLQTPQMLSGINIHHHRILFFQLFGFLVFFLNHAIALLATLSIPAILFLVIHNYYIIITSLFLKRKPIPPLLLTLLIGHALLPPHHLKRILPDPVLSLQSFDDFFILLLINRSLVFQILQIDLVKRVKVSF